MTDRAHARYEQGLAAYHSGQSVMHLIDVGREIEKEHRAENLSEKDHDDIARANHALVAGFVDGLISDIRAIVDSPSVTRRGQTA